jgi:hypothetical protein
VDKSVNFVSAVTAVFCWTSSYHPPFARPSHLGIFTKRRPSRKAEVYRTAGEIALMSPERDAAEAEAYFERALAVARETKSWELRAAMSMARLWREGQSKAGLRSSRTDLWLVHRRLRHAGLEGGKGAGGAAQAMSQIRKWQGSIGPGQYFASQPTNLPKGKASPKIAIEFGLLTRSQKQNMIRRLQPPVVGISSRPDPPRSGEFFRGASGTPISSCQGGDAAEGVTGIGSQVGP